MQTQDINTNLWKTGEEICLIIYGSNTDLLIFGLLIILLFDGVD